MGVGSRDGRIWIGCVALATEDMERTEDEVGDEGVGGEACWLVVEVGDVGHPALSDVLEMAEEGAVCVCDDTEEEDEVVEALDA